MDDGSRVSNPHQRHDKRCSDRPRCERTTRKLHVVELLESSSRTTRTTGKLHVVVKLHVKLHVVLERKEKNNQQVSIPSRERVQQKALHFNKPSQAPMKSGSGLFLEMAQKGEKQPASFHPQQRESPAESTSINPLRLH